MGDDYSKLMQIGTLIQELLNSEQRVDVKYERDPAWILGAGRNGSDQEIEIVEIKLRIYPPEPAPLVTPGERFNHDFC